MSRFTSPPTSSGIRAPSRSAGAPPRRRGRFEPHGRLAEPAPSALAASTAPTPSSRPRTPPPGTGPGRAGWRPATRRWPGHAGPRSRTPTRRVAGVHSRSRLGPPFSASGQRPLHAWGMHPEPALLLEQRGQPGGAQGRVGGQRLFEPVDDLVGELVRPLRSGTLGQQPGHPARLENRLSLVEGRSREAEVGGHLADRLALLAAPTQHLVLDLDHVARVEEQIAGREGGVADRLWPRVEGVVATQGRFLVLAGSGGPRRHPSSGLKTLCTFYPTSSPP